MINPTFKKLSEIRDHQVDLKDYKIKRNNTLNIIRLIALNHFYFCPMSITDKKPLSGYSWSIDLNLSNNDKDNAHTLRIRKHTRALNTLFRRCLHFNQMLNKSDLDRALSILYLMLDYDSYSIHLGESNLFVFDCDVFNHNSNQITDEIKPDRTNQRFCIGLKKLCKFLTRNKISIDVLENTMTVLTTSGGLHFYFRLPDSLSDDSICRLKRNGALKAVDTSLRNKENNTPDSKSQKLLKGVCDFLSGNAIILAPYSLKMKQNSIKMYKPIRIHLDRSHYGYFSFQEIQQAVIPSIQPLTPDIQECISKRIADISKPVKKANSNNVFDSLELDSGFTPTERQNRHAENIYMKQLKKLDECKEGERISTLISVSYTVGAIFHYLDCSIELVQSVLINKALNIGLKERETRDAVKNGLERGIRQPFILSMK